MVERTDLYIITIVFSLAFNFLGYTFTYFGAVDLEDYDVSIDSDDLISAGITFTDALSQNIVYDANWKEYALINKTIRCMWDTFRSGESINTEGLRFQRQNPMGKLLNNWWFTQDITVRGVKVNYIGDMIYNFTIIENWDQNYNWSRFVLQDGFQVLITPSLPTSNITQAVYIDASLNVTIGHVLKEEGMRWNVIQFLAWYWGTIVSSSAFGMPSNVRWFIRAINAVMLISGILLVRELRPW